MKTSWNILKKKKLGWSTYAYSIPLQKAYLLNGIRWREYFKNRKTKTNGFHELELRSGWLQLNASNGLLEKLGSERKHAQLLQDCMETTKQRKEGERMTTFVYKKNILSHLVGKEVFAVISMLISKELRRITIWDRKTIGVEGMKCNLLYS